jgi:hypothetical protein
MNDISRIPVSMGLTATFLVALFLLPACGGRNDNGSSSPANVGGGYTLQAVGGTLNSGSADRGLAVLATLRDAQGIGPGLTGDWQLKVTGPGITTPLAVSYDDGSVSSYMAWEWDWVSVSSGVYTVEATNGATTLIYSFTLDAARSLGQPAINKSGTTVVWSSVPGAGSYSYHVTDGAGFTLDSGYLTESQTSFSLASSLPDGSYLIEVTAHVKNRLELMDDSTASPLLSSQDDASVATMDIVMSGGVAGSYDIKASGGTLYIGKDASHADRYGLVIWTSLLTSAGTQPAGDWTLSVVGPGIRTPIVFTYPKTYGHYVYWDYGTTPSAGVYTVSATTPGQATPLTANFTIANTVAQLPVVTGITVNRAGDYTIGWNAVAGAQSYYVNLWADVSGVYTETANVWVDGSTLTANVLGTVLSAGTIYDVYVTACTLDMTTVKSPPPAPGQVNMSDNTFAPFSFTAQ